MKAAPVHRALGEADPALERILVHTGQHYDAEMSDVFLGQLGLPVPDFFLGVGSGSHAQQTARVLVEVERVVLETRPDLVVVSGDVNSTLAAALAAVKLRVPVAHIESGLRSFDDAMPEEHNRRLTDHMSDVLLAHSESAVENLRREGIDGERVHLVGNTMIDSLFQHLDAARARHPWRRFGLDEQEYALVTLHRPALVDDPELLAATVSALGDLARSFPVVFPTHPRTRGRMERQGLVEALENSRVHVSEPLGYLDFLGLEAGARVVVTDSGGVQEETSVLGVPCFTIRDTTERPITFELGTNTVLGARPERIAEIPLLLDASPPAPHGPIPLWDGHAGGRAAAVIVEAVS